MVLSIGQKVLPDGGVWYAETCSRNTVNICNGYMLCILVDVIGEVFEESV